MEDVAAEEGGAISVAPVPNSSVAMVEPTMFLAWVAQGEADGVRIWGFYAYLDRSTGHNGGEILSEIATLE